MKKNFKFSPEFRQSAVSRVLNGETQVEVAKSLGISPKTLNVWCLKAKEARSEQENKNLDETARLRLELKKAQAEIEFKKISGTRLFVKGWTTIFPDYSIFKWSSQANFSYE